MSDEEEVLVEVRSIRRAVWSALAVILIVIIVSTIADYCILGGFTSALEDSVKEADFGDEMQLMYDSG